MTTEKVTQAAEASLTATVAMIRYKLLKSLQSQLDELVTDELQANEEGVPFRNVAALTPQAEAIKKVINCLYHTEHLLTHIETITSASSWEQIQSVPAVVNAVNQLFNSLALLDNAEPEIQYLFECNYNNIEKLITDVYTDIQRRGYINQFSKLDKVRKAQYIIDQSLSLLGPDVQTPKPEENKQSALVEAFSKIGQILEVILYAQGKSLTDEKLDECIELFCQLLVDLDNNPVFRKLTHEEIKDTVMFKEFMEWVNTAQEEGIQFTPKSIKKYITWFNKYLPELVKVMDRLEQQNYLKQALLSGNIVTKALLLGEEANKQIQEQQLDIDVAVINTEELGKIRSDAIGNRQLELLSKLQEIEQQQAAAETFYAIISAYNQNHSNYDLSVICESDRHIILQIYPLLQKSLAHCDLDIVNAVTHMLKIEGPETNSPTIMHSVHGAIANATHKTTINSLFKTRTKVHAFHARQVTSERTKFKITEKHREKILAINKPLTEFDSRVAERMKELRIHLPKPKLPPSVPRNELKETGVIQLNTMRGAFNYMQHQDYARKIKEYRKLAIELMLKHIPPENRLSFMSDPPYVKANIELNEVQQLKDLLNAMHHLEQILVQFQNLSPNAQMIEQMQFIYRIKDSAREFQICLTAISPMHKKHISPIVHQLNQIGTNIYTLAGSEDAAVTPVAEAPSTETINESLEKPPEAPAPYDYSEEIKLLQKQRQALINRCKDTLAPSLTRYLTPNEVGMPYTDYENEPPQVQTIKKLINSIYTVEMAYQVWSRKKEIPVTHVDYLIYVQQSIAACTQIYKSLELLNSAPDIQHFIADNFDIFGPVYKGMEAFVKTNDIRQKAESTDFTKKSGQFIGKAVNLLQPDLDKEHHSSPIIQVLYGLPIILNSISTAVDKSTEATPGELKINAKKIRALSNVFEYLFTDSGSGLAALGDSGEALETFATIMYNISKENALFSKTTIKAYQTWMKKYYPMILADIDALEIEYNYAPGALSKAITEELDQINGRINDTIEESYSTPENHVEPIFTSEDKEVAEYRATALLSRKNTVLAIQNRIQQQNLAAIHFFTLLENYQFTDSNKISFEDLQQLKLLFYHIQLPLANVGYELNNQITRFFNNPTNSTLPIKDILKLRPALEAYQKQEKLRCDLKIEVIDGSLKELDLLQYPPAPFMELEALPDKAPTVLKPITMDQVHFSRGNLSYLQDLKLSHYTKVMKEAFRNKTRTYLSKSVLDSIPEIGEDECHVVNDNDPNLVRQIKNVENALVKLNLAFVHFEQMDKGRSMVFQAQAFIHVRQEAIKAIDAIMKLPPDLKKHYGPLLTDITKFCNEYQKFKYDVDDVEKLKEIPEDRLKAWYDDDVTEIGLILKGTKQEILRKNRDRAPHSRTAFFKRFIGDQMTAEERTEWAMDTDERPENARELNKRTAILTTKYAHMISPEIEIKRKALIKAFPTLNTSTPTEFGHLTHEQLADKEYLKLQFEKLQRTFSTRYGYNIKTATSLYKLFRQILRAGSQLDEFGGLVNRLVTDEFALIKEKTYSELLHSISSLEDNLGYKPGLLLNNAMAQMNQLFLSIAEQLDMPFENKMELFNQGRFINKLISKNEMELLDLNIARIEKPKDPSLLLQIKLKQDKLEYFYALKEQADLEFANTDNKQKIKEDLVASMFEVIVQRQIERLALLPDIGKQYADHARKLFKDNEANLYDTEIQKIDSEIHQMMTKFRKENQANYVLVSKAITSLERLPPKLVGKYPEAHTYMTNLVNDLYNGETEMFLRAQKVRGLPDDEPFNTQLNSVEGGPSFLTKFSQFIERLVASLVKAVRGIKDFDSSYEHKHVNQTLRNVETIERKLRNR